ncbi:5910_t:CDS:2, partial [Paraglomus occultum]
STLPEFPKADTPTPAHNVVSSVPKSLKADIKLMENNILPDISGTHTSSDVPLSMPMSMPKSTTETIIYLLAKCGGTTALRE